MYWIAFLNHIYTFYLVIESGLTPY